jgi:hypothetical protein
MAPAQPAFVLEESEAAPAEADLPVEQELGPAEVEAARCKRVSPPFASSTTSVAFFPPAAALSSVGIRISSYAAMRLRPMLESRVDENASAKFA